ncbi:helix-turn-helix domain-containing protein [Enterocloster bolteae]|uniref:helix-turn-helix transcriptional regulator n=1 Tax=Clostridia TaxID=186801 RepID=UPI000CCE3850|nr:MULTISPECIES: helix-turn-helix transcriptional regulator [Clostridia]MBS6219466.1 helix-turn-helix transcriptional regulator [[Clostridium] symbiosum]MCB6928354.1 helix-turn-helix domain-containing protein [Enterocloster bolteae]PNV63051.1 XRE family transcriptional regulator [Clostridium sp. chh4-2]
MENIQHSLGSIIKKSRLDQHITQEELARAVDITPRFIMAIENEGKLPSFEVLYKLIRTLNIQADSIFYPERKTNDALLTPLLHAIYRCNEKQLRVLTATVGALLDEL